MTSHWTAVLLYYELRLCGESVLLLPRHFVCVKTGHFALFAPRRHVLCLCDLFVELADASDVEPRQAVLARLAQHVSDVGGAIKATLHCCLGAQQLAVI